MQQWIAAVALNCLHRLPERMRMRLLTGSVAMCPRAFTFQALSCRCLCSLHRTANSEPVSLFQPADGKCDGPGYHGKVTRLTRAQRESSSTSNERMGEVRDSAWRNTQSTATYISGSCKLPCLRCATTAEPILLAVHPSRNCETCGEEKIPPHTSCISCDMQCLRFSATVQPVIPQSARSPQRPRRRKRAGA